MVHAPNHVPGQKLITVGHEYSVLVYLPDRGEDKEKQWIGLLTYNMLYYARSLAKLTRYPWEKKKVEVLGSIERPSQIQRDYNRIIPEIGTPAPFHKPPGKSPGRRFGHKIGARPECPIIRKSVEKEDNEPSNEAKKQKKVIQQDLNNGPIYAMLLK